MGDTDTKAAKGTPDKPQPSEPPGNDLALETFIQSMGFDEAERSPAGKPTRYVLNDARAISPELESFSVEERFRSSLALALLRMQADTTAYQSAKATGLNTPLPAFDKATIQNMIADIDGIIEDQINEILHHPDLRKLESQWRGIADLVENTNFKKNVSISLFDASKEELGDDLELNYADIAGSELYKKLYVSEYDQFGGEPFGATIGLWSFRNTPADIQWLAGIGKIAEASHAPFIASVDPMFFGRKTMAEVAELNDIGGLLAGAKYAKWNELRNKSQAAYIGLTLPRVLVRAPYNDETNPAGMNFTERSSSLDDGPRPRDESGQLGLEGLQEDHYLWGSAALPFARNLVACFARSGWCQNIRGPKAGGLVSGLPSYEFPDGGETVLKPPVEIAVPDFRELELARAGFIPLVQKKGSSDAVFFSAQSIKRAKDLKDDHLRENAQLVTNLSYTFSISRIAHYLKCIMRNNIGSTADQQYVFNQIDRWVARYVTAIVNPDDLTLQYYPFKAYALEVAPMSGRAGWYHCNLTVQPHIQFEGMHVDLRVDARLG